MRKQNPGLLLGPKPVRERWAAEQACQKLMTIGHTVGALTRLSPPGPDFSLTLDGLAAVLEVTESRPNPDVAKKEVASVRSTGSRPVRAAFVASEVKDVLDRVIVAKGKQTATFQAVIIVLLDQTGMANPKHYIEQLRERKDIPANWQAVVFVSHNQSGYASVVWRRA